MPWAHCGGAVATSGWRSLSSTGVHPSVDGWWDDRGQSQMSHLSLEIYPDLARVIFQRRPVGEVIHCSIRVPLPRHHLCSTRCAIHSPPPCPSRLPTLPKTMPTASMVYREPFRLLPQIASTSDVTEILLGRIARQPVPRPEHPPTRGDS